MMGEALDQNTVNPSARDNGPDPGFGSYELLDWIIEIDFNGGDFSANPATLLGEGDIQIREDAFTFIFGGFMDEPSTLGEFIFLASFLNNGQDPDTPWDGDLAKVGGFQAGRLNIENLGDVARVSSAKFAPIPEDSTVPVPEPASLAGFWALGFFLLQSIKAKQKAV